MIPIERRISDDTRLIDLTVGELKELMGALIVKQEDNEVKSSSNNLVYGIKGISELFKCSANTAMRLKNDVISKAVSQVGRKIVVDADMALMLFKNYEKKSGR